MRPRRSRPSTPSHQRGQALILTALLIIVGFGALLFSSTILVSNSIANQHANSVEFELAKARDALIGWSASRTPPVGGANARPGDLPCPDMNNDGFEDGSCVAGAIGRMPWKTLNIPEPKDSAAETLWYAIAGPFRNYNMNSAPITSDTLGDLTLYIGSSATTLTSQAIAVIFVPGASLGTQNRDPSANALCATTGTTIARNLCATNYLEPTGGGNNAQTGGPFIQAQSSGTFNDRLLVITNAELMPVVEQRVAREMRSLLQGYKAATATSASYPGGVYPWADNFNGVSNDGENRHRFPCGTASPVNWNTLVPGSVPGTNTPALPNWLTNGCGSNSVGWSHIIYYAVGRNYLEAGGASCVWGYCQDPTLSVNGVPGFEIVLLTPGAASASPRGAWPTAYLEDAGNDDDNDDDYVTPTSTAYTRDRIFTIP